MGYDNWDSWDKVTARLPADEELRPDQFGKTYFPVAKTGVHLITRPQSCPAQWANSRMNPSR
jgi:hypothetical protein